MTRRRGRRRKQLLDEGKEKRRYWELKEEALDRTLQGTCFGKGCGLVTKVRKRGYWELKKEALDRTLQRTCFGKGCGPVTVHTADRMAATLTTELHSE